MHKEVESIFNRYPLSCYCGDIGLLINLDGDFIDVGGYDEGNYLPLEVLTKFFEKYKNSRAFVGCTLFRGNPDLTSDNEYVFEMVSHIYFEIIEDGKSSLYTIMKYKGDYYLSYQDMYLQSGMTKQLLEKKYSVVETEDGTVGITLVALNDNNFKEQIKEFEYAFCSHMLRHMGLMGSFINQFMTK